MMVIPNGVVLDGFECKVISKLLARSIGYFQIQALTWIVPTKTKLLLQNKTKQNKTKQNKTHDAPRVQDMSIQSIFGQLQIGHTLPNRNLKLAPKSNQYQSCPLLQTNAYARYLDNMPMRTPYPRTNEYSVSKPGWDMVLGHFVFARRAANVNNQYNENHQRGFVYATATGYRCVSSTICREVYLPIMDSHTSHSQPFVLPALRSFVDGDGTS